MKKNGAANAKPTDISSWYGMVDSSIDVLESAAVTFIAEVSGIHLDELHFWQSW